MSPFIQTSPISCVMPCTRSYAVWGAL